METPSPTGPTAARGADDFPSYLKLVLNCWKGQHAKYCPVYWLSAWLSAADIKNGPIYPNLVGRKKKQRVLRADQVVKIQDHQSITRIWHEVDENGAQTRCNLTKGQVSGILNKMCTDAGYPGCSSYTFKKMAVQWAVRSNATVPQIKAAGRWKSNAWEQYAQGGFNDKQAWEQSGQDDPIRKMWVFRPALWDTTVAMATEVSTKKNKRRKQSKKGQKVAKGKTTQA